MPATASLPQTLTAYHAKYYAYELGEHAHTHIVPRLTKVIASQEGGGVTESTGWKGGGGFRYYRLVPSLLQRDKRGNWVINKSYKAAMLAEALCKLEGFEYGPSETVYWQHGRSTERDFIYVTTQHLTHEQLLQLSADVGPDQTLLAICTAFRGKAEAYPNLTIKEIPKTVLPRCEWGRDDYSLEVANLPLAPSPVGQQGPAFEGR
jgi:adenine-specific DNA-methyltransferase